MKHPHSLPERRHNRVVIMARRRKQMQYLWYFGQDNRPWTNGYWYQCAKQNLNCGCKMCHGEKYYKQKRKRRRGRRAAESPAECRVRDRRVRL